MKGKEHYYLVHKDDIDFGPFLNSFTVKVKSDGGIGTGILVTKRGIILTCYNVIGNYERIFDNIEIQFNDGRSYSAQILSKASGANNMYDSVNDIALLEISDPPYFFDDNQDFVCPLSESISTGHDFYTFSIPMGILQC